MVLTVGCATMVCMKSFKTVIRRPRIAPVVVTAIGFLAAGTVFYKHIENLTWLDSLFFCVMTLTTIGYSHVPITSEAGKIFTIVYAIFGVVILASAANYLVQKALVRHVAVQPKDTV